MKRNIRLQYLAAMSLAVLLAGCASMEQMLAAPSISLRNVQVQKFDHKAQTFLLGFDITNPNPFPLPVKHVSYGVELDGQHFAGGSAASDFTVGAQSDAEFSISVELDLLRTAPQLLYVVHDGVTRDIPYRLNGEIGVDIPFTKPLRFQSSGEIRLFAGAR